MSAGCLSLTTLYALKFGAKKTGHPFLKLEEDLASSVNSS